MWIRVSMMVTVFCLLVASIYAQNEVKNLPMNEQMSQSNASGDLSGAASPVGEENVSISKEGIIDSLNFHDADLRNVLKILALKSGINIVAGPEVTGTVTMQLSNVPWQQALDVILQTYGFAFEKKGNIIVVTTVDSLKKRRDDAQSLAQQEPLETQTFILNFGKASEIIQSIAKMKTDRGSINFDERTNTIIVTDTPKTIDLISQVITSLDTTTPQVLIEAKIIETTLSNSDKLGIDFTALVTASGSKVATTFPFAQSSTNKFFRDAFQGISSTNFAYGTLNFSQASAAFEMLKSRDNTNLLSSPRVATLDNKPARIVVGKQYPIPTYTFNEQQARLQVSGWEYKDIGIIFDVTPHINATGYVLLDIEPKLTDIISFVTVENTSLPQLSNESTKTSVMIKDGETLVISGLLTDKTTDTKKKLPIVGDIPILGLAFTKSVKLVEKRDLMVFITPHIITPEILANK